MISLPLPMRRNRLYRHTQLAVYDQLVAEWDPHHIAEVVEQQFENSGASPLSRDEKAVVSRWAEGLMKMVVPGVFAINDPYYLKGGST